MWTSLRVTYDDSRRKRKKPRFTFFFYILLEYALRSRSMRTLTLDTCSTHVCICRMACADTHETHFLCTSRNICTPMIYIYYIINVIYILYTYIIYKYNVCILYIYIYICIRYEYICILIIYILYILYNITGEVDVNGRRVRRLETANKGERQTHY
jgi:hypothetical protein